MKKSTAKAILFVAILAAGFNTMPARCPEPEVPKYVEPKTVPDILREHFPKNYAVMGAIMKAESGGNPEDVNWNCMYGKKSMPCRNEDRHRAWSVDCGLMQINTKGTECPKELFEPETNMREARRIYDEQGLGAWVVYKTGKYREYL